MTTHRTPSALIHGVNTSHGNDATQHPTVTPWHLSRFNRWPAATAEANAG
jgi:hypothetical protein